WTQPLQPRSHGLTRLELLQRRTCAGSARRLACTFASRESPQGNMNGGGGRVTGGAGFLGSHLCDALLADGYSVTAVDNLITGRLSNLEHLANDSRFDFQRRDVSEPFDCGPVDYVFHFASPASPVDYSAHEIPTLRVGSLGTFHSLAVRASEGAT